MESGLLTFAYLTASVLFILSLRGLSSQETARQGNLYGMLGMLVAVLATAASPQLTSYPQIGAVMGIAVVLGAVMAARVAMTGMPELVAILHSFVGLAAVLVGLAAYYDATEGTGGGHHGAGETILLIEIFIDVLIGAITFTGSVIAWGKLRGSITGKALMLPGRHLMNLALFVGCIVCAVWLVQSDGREGLQPLLITIALASLLGVHLVMAIGGADMPVVVSMLNSYSGWTAAAAGFMLSNDLLIITGALVGSSGAILSIIMCRAMNRSIVSVMLGGFGSSAGKASKKPAGPAPEGDVSELDVEGMVELLRTAKDVMIIPGYGMARARAQHAIRDLTSSLQELGANVRFGIHPVAGRLPGHMNVLLAEADVPYDIVFEMDEINGDFPNVDVCLVLGANDIVNPGAETDESSPIYGMPVLKVWESKCVVICKRSRNVGYAGVDNPLFYHERASMLFGDAREMVETLVRAL
jgi:H+-translocating NAD(P) transhydrogenase subunit beta